MLEERVGKNNKPGLTAGLERLWFDVTKPSA
jgi:hypothetical protein